MADLRKCPFCGGEVKLIPEQVDSRTVIYNFVCQNGDCCANVYFDYSDREEAIEAWNTRKPMEAVVAELNETGRKFCENVGCSKECENCEHGALMRTIIEIVRGKE